ncbi:MAG: hypothetical protein LBV51_01745 [Acholeplasmatales bacterium]|nr:hypothetical protein [Acholeplasmatales bacterium]
MDKYCAYYTKSNSITDYMVKMIDLNASDHLLEQCGGDGAFIDALVNKKSNLLIDTVDIDMEAINILRKKYGKFDNISIRKADTLLDFSENDIESKYTKIIGNPYMLHGKIMIIEKNLKNCIKDIMSRKHINYLF